MGNLCSTMCLAKPLSRSLHFAPHVLHITCAVSHMSGSIYAVMRLAFGWCRVVDTT